MLLTSFIFSILKNFQYCLFKEEYLMKDSCQRKSKQILQFLKIVAIINADSRLEF